MRCRDTEAMIGWLKDVVGFTERVVYRNGDMVQHAELAYGPSLLMLGQCRDDEYRKLVGDVGGPRTDAPYIAVDDPHAVLQRPEAPAGPIKLELHPTDSGSRDFACRDPEGNLWSF